MQDSPPPIVCERCNAADAVIHLMRVRDGVRAEHHYCVACARELGVDVIVVTVESPPTAR
jgi:protein-arginine kinase activator protein McsA